MTTDANLVPALVEVTPGDEAQGQLEIRNDGSIVESYEFEVVGETAAWTTVDPPVVSVYPGTSAQVTLRFRPPRSAAVVAGELPFAVRVTPQENPEGRLAPEGVLRVLPFHEVKAEITPRTSRGRWGGRHEVSVTNLSNVPLGFAIAAHDPDARLRFAIRPERLTVEPGQATFVRVRARSRRTLWRGHPVTLPFQVGVASEQAPSKALDATTVQEPLLPRNLGRLVAALLVLLLVGAGLWYALLRPAVRSLAREVTRQEVAPVAKKADEANKKADRVIDEMKPTTPAPTPSKPVLPPPSPTPPGLPGLPPGAETFNRRLAVTTGTGATRTDQYTVPSGKAFVLTDIFLQNPQGDGGRLDLVVNGATVLTVALNNFRDLDYHLVSPIEVPAGRTVSLRVTCRTAGAALPGAGSGGQCRDYALLSGYHRPTAGR